MRIFVVAWILASSLPAADLDVRLFGAVGDGRTKDTAAIQRAVDEAARRGGGTVLLSAGRYLSGTLFLKSGVRFFLDAGAVLAMSPDDEDFAPYEPPPALLSKRVSKYSFSTRGLARAAALPPTEDDSETTYMRHALLLGEEVAGVTIEGRGTIDGNRSRRGGPKPVAFKNSRDISIQGVTIANAPNYAISLLAADQVAIDSVRIINAYADGIDPDNSHYVRISNCYIDSWDDAICPKASLALGRRRSTEHLAVTNCTLRTACSAFKFGTESAGGFKHVTVSNLTILPREGEGRPPIAGIALESVDGADIEAVSISNVVMRDVRTPIFLRVGARGRGMDEPRPGTMRDVVIQGVVATGATLASSITAVQGAAVRAVTLNGIHIESTPPPGLPSFEVPEEAEKYPEANMFGDLPASGLYVRRAIGLRLGNLTLRSRTAPDRPVIALDQVEDVSITSFAFSPPPSGQPPVWVRGAAAPVTLEGSPLVPLPRARPPRR